MVVYPPYSTVAVPPGDSAGAGAGSGKRHFILEKRILAGARTEPFMGNFPPPEAGHNKGLVRVQPRGCREDGWSDARTSNPCIRTSPALRLETRMEWQTNTQSHPYGPHATNSTRPPPGRRRSGGGTIGCGAATRLVKNMSDRFHACSALLRLDVGTEWVCTMYSKLTMLKTQD